nr:hypothetical protein HK105_000102 [Polyrhizophydium stewartii]
MRGRPHVVAKALPALRKHGLHAPSEDCMRYFGECSVPRADGLMEDSRFVCVTDTDLVVTATDQTRIERRIALIDITGMHRVGPPDFATGATGTRLTIVVAPDI